MSAMGGMLPVIARRVTLRCLRDTDIGAFPEFRLGAFLLSVDKRHKNHGDSIALEVPRSAKVRYEKGQHFEFRLFAAPTHRSRLDRIEAMLRGLPGLARVSAPDLAFGDNWALQGIEDLYANGPLMLDDLAGEVAQWRDVTRFRVRLSSPWRIVLSGGNDDRRARDILRNPAHMDDALLGRVLTQSLVALKFQFGAHEWHVPEFPLRIIDQSLWCVGSPASPGGKHPNVFEEGLLGECTVEWAAPPEDDHWRHLLLLTRFGAGQSRAFGLGRLQLERIDQRGARPPQAAEGIDDLCERLFPNWEDFASLPRASARDAVIRLHDEGWRPRLSIALPASRSEEPGIASPESRISSLLGMTASSHDIDAMTGEQRDAMRRAVHYAMLSRTCQRHRLRMVWCQHQVLLLSRRGHRESGLITHIRQALQSEAIQLGDDAIHDLADPAAFAWIGYRFLGGLTIPGRKTARMCAIDEDIDSEAESSQAA